MRVHHYVKNILVFSALACSGKMFEVDLLLKNVIGFMSFCLAASSIYIINDIRDKENDAKHPVKCKRPISSIRQTQFFYKIWIIIKYDL